jgi:NADH:ubiquinone oxidoreductase subunit E
MKTLLICVNHRDNPTQPSCAARGSPSLAVRLEQEIASHGWDIRLERSTCLGRCSEGPNLKLAPGGKFCSNITPDNLSDLIQDIENFANSPEASS